MDFMKGNLTYKAWIPFDYTPSIIFYFVFTHQMIGMSMSAVVNVACDSLIVGLLQEICCQFEILEYRLMKILHDQHILRDCVRHHDRIYELVFKTILLFQKIGNVLVFLYMKSLLCAKFSYQSSLKMI